MNTVIAMDRKDGELIDCRHLMSLGLPVYPIHVSELQIAALQPPPGVTVKSFIAVIVQLVAIHLHLFASRRLLSETLTRLFKRERPRRTYPVLSEWMSSIDAIRANVMSRIGGYREACLFGLQSLYNELGLAIDYTQSNFLERVFTARGCIVVLTGGLSIEAASFLASLFINWIYMARATTNPDDNHLVVFVLDDALPLIYGSTAAESEGSMNPLATWSFMGRSRKIGFVCAAQNFSVVSPAFRNNASSIVCFGSYGRDAEELARHLHLTPEQAAVLPLIQPGEAVAVCRSVWPLPVRGTLGELL